MFVPAHHCLRQQNNKGVYLTLTKCSSSFSCTCFLSGKKCSIIWYNVVRLSSCCLVVYFNLQSHPHRHTPSAECRNLLKTRRRHARYCSSSIDSSDRAGTVPATGALMNGYFAILVGFQNLISLEEGGSKDWYHSILMSMGFVRG